MLQWWPNISVQHPPSTTPRRKKPTVYLVIILIWLALTGWAIFDIHQTFLTVWGPLCLLNFIFLAYFWLNGTKDVVYPLSYYSSLRHVRRLSHHRALTAAERAEEPMIFFLYCTADDFEERTLAENLKQEYGNVRFFILDDSKQTSYQERVNAFAGAHDIEVVRRSVHSGHKAGNLNHFLLGRDDYDYFVILDSDEIIPPNYVRKTLCYFTERVGVVQCSHRAAVGGNLFEETFRRGVDSHWPVYQQVKDRFGFMHLMGHGAMISRRCYQAVPGGFPEMVAEDLCFSIEARLRGFITAFCASVVCVEAYPISYLAFKTRHSKWTQGNMEFIRHYSWPIFSSSLHWWEKLDILLFTYNLPLTAVFVIYLFLNIVVFPLFGVNLGLTWWMLIVTVVFLLAPMLNDFIWHLPRIGVRRMFFYTLGVMLLYGSLFYISAKASLFAFLGKKAQFLVTPKSNTHLSLRDAFVANRSEMLFGLGLCAVALLCGHSLLPVLLLAIPALLSPIMALLSNDPVPGQKGGLAEHAKAAEPVQAPAQESNPPQGTAPTKPEARRRKARLYSGWRPITCLLTRGLPPGYVTYYRK
ncbi:MAG: glycosyltransferase family 2 protein [Coriobacteriales bacterium]|jgi:cellulose synthase/poly-beta-1,6-N-acetylglucosamine synthase-like glycosyltransferase|nr:glycosyltransferase family 2 protein [Coriobacteriales bacterium]